ncbi:hypothetical protein ABFT23_16845 [Nocardioides sp. C4-1]|uniref:hypothetical protein n=1 Tax=Nocardioides sp. C4-1 TaxID=3151851 RepID=UPI0032668E6D
MRSIGVLARVIPAVAVMATIGVVAWLVVPRLDLGGDDGVEVGEPVDVDEWPEELRPFVEFVEEERDLRFLEVVDVELMKDKAFEQAVTDDEELTDEDRDEIEQAQEQFRALGLVGPDVDLYAESQRLQGAGVVGFYSFDDRDIKVRGTELTPSTRATLVHELVHALQDQHFDISDRAEELSEREDGSSTAFRALVEGDASRVGTAWKAQLDDEEKAALEKETTAETEAFESASADIPPVLVALLGAPYALGETMVDLAVALDDVAALDGLFDAPPTTEEEILDPWVLLRDQDAAEPVDVDVPETGEGEEQTDSGPFGAFGWYVVLAQRVDVATALEAADGWGGDAYSAFERDGGTCLRIAYRGDTPQDVDQMAAALEEWIADSPDTALLQRTDDGLTFASCESGETPPSGRADEIISLPAIRTTLTTQLVDSGAPDDVARCFATRAVQELTIAELSSSDPADAEKFQRLAVQCR